MTAGTEIERLKLHLDASIGMQRDMEGLIQAIHETVLDPYSGPMCQVQDVQRMISDWVGDDD